MRKLASIRTIGAVLPIANADAIEIAQVDGWQCVVKKGEFAVGDPCVYFEIDSVLPVRPEYEFLRNGCYRKAEWLPGGEGFRIKTIKLRGQISQGLALPLSACPIVNGESGIVVGGVLAPLSDDVTEILGVSLWDPPLPKELMAVAVGYMPTDIPKTTQERAQNCLRKLAETHGGHTFEATMKLDGWSCTIYARDGVIGVVSWKVAFKMNIDGNAFVDMARKVGPAILSTGRNLAFQGELMGPGIQGNREGFTEHHWFVFDVWDIDAQCYLTAGERWALIERIGLTHVPVLDNGMLAAAAPLSHLLSLADELSSLRHPVAEGIVYKSVQDPSVSFKVISNRFLVKCEA